MIATINNLPVYSAEITDEMTGMLRISLVDFPAVMSDFFAFADEKPRMLFAVEDEEKRLVRGVIMRADFPIFRTGDPSPYYIVYKADTIRKMAEKYLADDRQNLVNLMHSENSDVEGVQMVQWFIKDTANGVNPSGFEDIADGSLFAEFHVHNDEVWQSIRDGAYRGFSLEGIFDFLPEEDQDEMSQIADELVGKFKRHNPTLTINKMKVKRFMANLARAIAKFGTITTDKGILAYDGGDDLAIGDEVKIQTENGEEVAAEDGPYTAEGTVYDIADGKVVDIREAEVAAPEPETEMASVVTDKGELLYEGELEVGTEVFVQTEDGQFPAEDGEYIANDGKTLIVVAEGKVTDIIDAEAVEEPSPAEEELRKQNEALRKELATLKAKVAKLEKMSAAKPAHEEVITSVKVGQTGNKGLDRLARIMSAK